MSSYCVSCGVALTPGDKFCAGCGAPAATEAAEAGTSPSKSPSPVAAAIPAPIAALPIAADSAERQAVTAVGKRKLIVRKKKPTAFESLRGNIHITIGVIGILIGAGLIISVAGIIPGAIVLLVSLYINYQGKFIKNGVVAPCPQCGNELKLMPPEPKEKCSECSNYMVIEWVE